MRRLASFIALSVLLGPAGAQEPKRNPLAEAARVLGTRGLGPETLDGKAGWPFKPSGGRLTVKGYVAPLSDDGDERTALEQGILGTIERYEKAADALKQPNDPATALGFSIVVLTSAAKGTDLDDAAFLALVPRLRAVLAKVSATDRQKQEFYETALCASGMVASLLAATSEPQAREKLKALAETLLLALIGTKSDAIVLNGSTVAIRGASKVASNLAAVLPAGWREADGWQIGQVRDGTSVHSALVRFLPAVPAQGSFSDALRDAWKGAVPESLRAKTGGMVFRRYVGDGLVAQFLSAAGPEPGRKWDTLFTVYLVDCGATWQPVVVAQTWGDASTSNPIYSPWTISGSFRTSAPLVETYLRGFACPAAKGKPLIDRASLTGTFYYGTSSGLQWTNVYTGASTMTVVSYGGSLTLVPTGKFSETYSSAGGVVGALKFRGFKAKGDWTLKGDLLTLTDTEYDQGDGFKRSPKRYRIAGIVTFPDGEKVIVLKDKLDEPVGPLTVGDSSEYYFTKKKARPLPSRRNLDRPLRAVMDDA